MEGEKVMIGLPGKQYGLQKPKVAAEFAAGDSDGDGEESAAAAAASFSRAHSDPVARARAERDAAAEQARVLAEDPTAYEYDSLYDSLHAKAEEQRQRTNAAAAQERKPQYMAGLQKMADRRKQFLEVAFDRKIQREAQKDMAEFGETERFVTSGYRERLEMDRRWAEDDDDDDDEGGVHGKDKGNRGSGDGKRVIDMSEFHSHMLRDIARSRGGEDTETDKAKDRLRAAKARASAEAKAAALEQSKAEAEAREREARRRDEEDRREAEEERRRKEKRAREMEEDLKKAEKEREAKEQRRKEETEAKLARRTTEGTVTSAKERFLARKEAMKKELDAARAAAAKDALP